MRILIFHGYLLGGTGSNVYNARLAEALVRLGHEVHLLCQERHPEEQAFVNAAGDWDGGELRVRELRAGAGGVTGSCTVYRPDIGGILPVYVLDRYEGVRARTFAELDDERIADYVRANVAAVRELCDLVAPELALANHLVMGPVILARGLQGKVPYAVKVHGSALEYTVKPQPQRFLGYAREGLAGAAAVLVGSRHTAESLWRALGDEDLPARTRLGPPGVDVERFVPRERDAAAAGLRALAARLREAGGAGQGPGPAEVAAPVDDGGEQSAFARDEAAAARELERLAAGEGPIVVFVGKLIVSKGVDLLVAAWPLVLAREPRARLAIVGFGAYRRALERLLAALADGDLATVAEIARAGRSLEGDTSAAPLRHLLAFLDGLAGERRESYVRCARGLRGGVVLTGRLEHDELADLLPACDAMVVPSTFPEAFGMVAAEAAACAVLPVSAAHSGLAEVSDELAGAVPEQAREWLSFGVDDAAVGAIAERVCGWLGAEQELRRRTRAGLVRTARERWSWEGVARGVIAAGQGRLEALHEP